MAPKASACSWNNGGAETTLDGSGTSDRRKAIHLCSQTSLQLDVGYWHLASIIAAQRLVRSWVQTGSGQPTAKVTRLTHLGRRQK